MASSSSSSVSLGSCPICGREMIDDGFSTDRHHFLPKSEGGVQSDRVHRLCHSFIHATWSEKELASDLSDPQLIREHPLAAAFLRWARKLPPQFVDRSCRSARKGPR